MELEKKKSLPVIGRFAPSPTGPLHFGSLVAALGSYLLAKQTGGQWLLRIEDLDPPRVIPGSADDILRSLDLFGFEWDGEVLYQSQRSERYREVLANLQQNHLLFPCSCTRRELIASAPHSGEDGPIYPGTCRQGVVGCRQERALRLRVPDEEIRWRDLIFGELHQNLQREVGDFILQRADGLFAYQLAVVVDDIDSSVNQVVRGADLLSSTPRQAYLYRCLQQPLPVYYHLPLALGDDRQKLSKRHGAAAIITMENRQQALWAALQFLGQSPPKDLAQADVSEQLAWGMEHFSPSAVTKEQQLVPAFGS
ncbi:tRNA glutamyl-Q(34) synthetase GluQRS [Malonomonas rubra]|uniref:tRNA glutamyl-Q(34) synthetase GluQRS n=1 Tax=Malonomonas rubra TaxID=57040 RepID=UPI0026F0599D|nr:tRNA glutamyl-Q(34) synthetase GluQRS [Malonomonas rubra]